MQVERIDIKLFDIPEQSIIEQKDCYWELHPDRLIQRFCFLYEQFKEDKALPPESHKANCLSTYKKEAVLGAEVLYQSSNKTWKVALIILGASDPSFFLFKDRGEAFKVQSQIVDWIFSK